MISLTLHQYKGGEVAMDVTFNPEDEANALKIFNRMRTTVASYNQNVKKTLGGRRT